MAAEKTLKLLVQVVLAVEELVHQVHLLVLQVLEQLTLAVVAAEEVLLHQQDLETAEAV